MSQFTYSIGYNSKGKYKIKENNKKTPAYVAWRNMLTRCYDPNYHKKYPSYAGCSIDKRFQDFQDFARWFYGHPHSALGYQLDKDILIPGNKTYSPDACCFVPVQLNVMLVDRARHKGKHPQGVDFRKNVGKYRARLNINGVSKHLGVFDCPNEAHQVYKAAKERHIKNEALMWANRIEWNVFVALMNWSLAPCDVL